MKLERKIFLFYALLILALIVLLGSIVRHYFFSYNKQKTIITMQTTALQSSKQLEELTHSMEFITDYILSDSNTLSAMNTMENIDSSTKSGFEFKETARMNIKLHLYTACIMKNFYKVSYFDTQNDLITSEFKLPLKKNPVIDSSTIPWLATAKSKFGEPVIGGAYKDPWVREDESVMVFGLGRAMPGKGYLEVQQPITSLDNIFSFRNADINAVAFDQDNNILYSNYPDLTKDQFLPYFSQLTATKPSFSLVDAKNDIIAGNYSPQTGIRIFLIQKLETDTPEIRQMDAIILLIALLILLASLVYIFIIAKKLSLPIKDLQRQIETTDLKNLKNNTNIETENDEIKAVSKAFTKLMEQLDEAIHKQKDMSLLYLQAQLNSLQAQINPHFLNNVLDVISCRGFDDDDEEICTICDNLAAMMQYSTNAKCHKATLREEFDNYQHYQYLLKIRYKEKLEIITDIDSRLLDQEVPRFLIQPIVENCISHGFENYSGPMKISLTGTMQNGWWSITVTDNGLGFTQSILDSLNKNMELIRQKLFVRHENIELSSGEIGIVNTYARMLLFYGSEAVVKFTLENVQEHGAKVTFGAIYREGTVG